MNYWFFGGNVVPPDKVILSKLLVLCAWICSIIKDSIMMLDHELNLIRKFCKVKAETLITKVRGI